jgi:hypothetical protein
MALCLSFSDINKENQMRTTLPALAVFMAVLLVACDSETSLPEKKTEALVRQQN